MPQAVLAMYDLRGIQDFIFSSNSMKEIAGASRIVEDLFDGVFKEIFEDEGPGFLSDWFDKQDGPLPYRFDGSDVQAEVLSVGGGNLLVAFKDATACRRVNRRLTRLVQKRTYSLQVAIAVVPKSSDYLEDYRQLKTVMGRIKAENRRALPVGGCPFTRTETTTGMPVVLTAVEFGVASDRSTETQLKRSAYERRAAEYDEYEKSLDNLVTEKGVESLIAVVHIDGNNVGWNILEGLKGCGTYDKAIPLLRKMSANIQKSFDVNAVEAVEQHLKGGKRSKTDAEGRQRLMFRPIVLAGDDVTFVCNARDALTLSEIFLQEIENGVLYEGAPHFSACAGVCYVHSHFPFWIAYELAEALTDSAKRVGKADSRNIRSAVDFHLAAGGVLDDLADIREKEYEVEDGAVSLLKRPYFLGNGDRSLGDFKGVLDNYHNRSKPIPRSWLKRARDAHHEGVQAAEELAAEAASRGYELTVRDVPLFTGGVSNYYDALELLDIAYDRA